MILLLWYLPILTYFLIYFTIFRYEIEKNKDITQKIILFNFAYSLIFIFFTLTFENTNDTKHYYYSFLFGGFGYGSDEFFFNFLQRFFIDIDRNFYTFFLLKKFYIVCFIIFFLYFYKKEINLPIFLFSPFILLSTENGLRQGGASIFFLLCVFLILKNKYFPAIVFAILSFGSHYSITIMILIFFISLSYEKLFKTNKKPNLFTIFSISALMVFVIFFFINNYAGNLYSGYFRESSNDYFDGSTRVEPNIKFLIFLIYFLLALITEYRKKINYFNSLFFTRNILGVMILLFYFLFDYSELASRLLFYFIAIDIFLLSLIVHLKKVHPYYILLTFSSSIFAPNAFVILMNQI